MADQILDACCVINLFGSGRLESVIAGCGGDFYVSEQVRAESLSIRQPDPNDPSVLVSVTIDLSGAISSGLILETAVAATDEMEAYVDFAVELDDGEASCLAIALIRGWTVATDDRKAKRLASQAGVDVITTPELIQRWANAEGASDAEVGDVLQSIERFARYRPRRSHPLYDWWSDLSSGAAGS